MNLQRYLAYVSPENVFPLCSQTNRREIFRRNFFSVYIPVHLSLFLTHKSFDETPVRCSNVLLANCWLCLWSYNPVRLNKVRDLLSDVWPVTRTGKWAENPFSNGQLAERSVFSCFLVTANLWIALRAWSTQNALVIVPRRAKIRTSIPKTNNVYAIVGRVVFVLRDTLWMKVKTVCVYLSKTVHAAIVERLSCLATYYNVIQNGGTYQRWTDMARTSLSL